MKNNNKKKCNEKIKCDVESCKYNNCDDECCELDSIKVSCTCDKDDCCECNETVCESFEEKNSDDDENQKLTDNEYEVESESEDDEDYEEEEDS